jgi:ABC-type lipoprotein release transport system permease subunit
MRLSAGTQAARIWAATDLRRRWRSLVVLGLLAGLSGALAMAALAGSRRADTAFSRLRERTNGADAVVFPSQVDPGIYDWSKISRLPYVEWVGAWSLVFGSSPGDPPGQTTLFMPTRRDGWLETVDRPIVMKGRMWRPSVPGEVMVDEGAAKAYGISVGDKVPFQAFVRGQFQQGSPKGAKFMLTVVAVIREPSQFLFTNGLVFLSPGTGVKYGKDVERIDNGHVKLRDPQHDIDKLRRDAGRLLAEGTPVLDLHSVEQRISTAVSVETVAQLLLGMAVAAAAIVFVGQALARSVSTIDDDALVLSGLGLTRSSRTIAAVLPHVLTAAVAVPIAFVGAVALSPRFPIGFARTVDPDVGVNVDWAVLAPGLVLLTLTVLGGAIAVAWRRSGRLSGEAVTSPNVVTAAVRRAVPLSVGLGTTMAFEQGRGRRSVPVRPALFGAIAGVLGIVGTYTIEHGLDDALSNPERAGVTWDATVTPFFDAKHGDYVGGEVDALKPRFIDAVKRQRDASDAAVIGRVVLDVDGAGVPVFDVKPVRGQLSLVATKGRAPKSASEAAIGPATAKQLGVEIGDPVTVSGTGRGSRKVTIVGEALFPNEVHSGFTEGLWLTPDAVAAVAPRTDFRTYESVEEFAAFRWRSGVDKDVALKRLQRDMSEGGRMVGPADVPPELVNLRRVRSVPAILVLFLVLLAVSTLAHVLVTSVRRRRGDFAVLRSLGFTRRMTSGVVATQSTAVGLVGLVVGIPLGLALGRLGWTWVAGKVPLVYASPITFVIVILTVPAALVVTNIVAALPGRRASRMAPAKILRTE